MPLASPHLDDRNFQQLLDECVQRVRQRCPEWNDLGPSDPGMVLLELFAHLTEVMIYRLNRVPEKAYVEFLRLMGVRLLPPAAAATQLRFQLARPAGAPVEIPRGTRVTSARGSGPDTPVFATIDSVTIPVGETSATIWAAHGEMIEGELAGLGTGLPGLSIAVRRPPIVTGSRDGLDLIVAVEVGAGEREAQARATDVKFLEHQGRPFRVWRAVDDFTDIGPDRFVYVVDRMSGVITFAPALHGRNASGHQRPDRLCLAESPAAGREIRVWYRRGGGAGGNVAADVLTVLKDPVPGVVLAVTNPEAAHGGASGETLENALARGPQELHTLERAVTAGDFKRIALKTSSAIRRARAFTQAALWKHAPIGTVEVLLVPDVPPALRPSGRIAPEVLRAQQSPVAREQIAAELEKRSPLGTRCHVGWVRYKEVRVQARVVIHREENEQAVRERVFRRLCETISPLPAQEGASGWRFGRPLRAFDVFDIILSEPGVSYADQVRLRVDDVPEGEVTAVAADIFQAKAWHLGAGERIYRSLNDGAGWERAATFPGEVVRRLRASDLRPGMLAAVTAQADDPEKGAIWTSTDCGESWTCVARTAYPIHDIAWLARRDALSLLLAADKGLFELALKAGAVPVPVLVDPEKQDQGFYAVAVTSTVRGEICVAAAATGAKGVFFSDREAAPGSFRRLGLEGEDVRVLALEARGPRRFLWAGVTVAGFEAGKGCFSFELFTGQENWTQHQRGWDGGSCVGLGFQGSCVVAATQNAGVLRLDATGESASAAWLAADVNCGLPLGDRSRFQRVIALAVDPQGNHLMAGTATGLFRSPDAGVTYQLCTQREHADEVTLPDTWLFCSGAHELQIVNEDETNRD
jgi:hypothetical protein